MHHQRVRPGKAQLLLIEAEEAEIFLRRRHETAHHPLPLQAQHHHDVGVFQSGAHVADDFDAHPLDACGQKRRGADDAHPRAERGEQDDIGARHPGMQNVAADRDNQTFDAPLAPPDRQGIEQRLRRVLMRPVSGVDDGAFHLLGQKMHRARVVVAHDDQVGAHGVQRRRRVDQRLALFYRRGCDRHVHHIGAEPFARELEGGLRAGGGLVEEIDLRAPGEHAALFLDLPGDVDGRFGKIEQGLDVRS